MHKAATRNRVLAYKAQCTLQAAGSEAAAAPEELKVEPSSEASPAAVAAIDASSTTLGDPSQL